MVSLPYSVLNNYLFVFLHQVAADSGGNNSSGSTAVSAAIQADLYSTKRCVFVPVPVPDQVPDPNPEPDPDQIAEFKKTCTNLAFLMLEAVLFPRKLSSNFCFLLF
jgi:hypothetical protein